MLDNETATKGLRHDHQWILKVSGAFEKVLDDFNDTPSVPRDIGIAPYSASAAGISMFQVR